MAGMKIFLKGLVLGALLVVGVCAGAVNSHKPVHTASYDRYAGGLARSLKANEIAKASNKSTPFDPVFSLAHTVFHTPSVSYWGGSNYEVVNVSSEDKKFRLEAMNGDTVLSTVDFVIPGRGVQKGTLESLFADYFAQDGVDVDAIDMFRVSVDVPEFGKSFTSATYEFKDRNEASSVVFVDDVAYHRLSVDHVIPGSQMEKSWWQGQDVNNVSDVPIDVVFEGDDGSSYVLVEDLQPGCDMTFLMRDLIGLDHSVVSGDFVAYVSDGVVGEVTGDPVDAITGLSVFGWRDGGYGLSEGLEQVGSFVDGSNHFSSSWSIPTGVVETASNLNNLGNNWLGVAYRNVTAEEQHLYVKQYGLDGTDLRTVIVEVPAGKKVAFLPEDFGFDSTVPGSLELLVDGYGSSIYLVGDEERSFMGGSMSPSVLSDYVEVPTRFSAGYSGVLSIMNPGDESVVVNVDAFNDAGVGLTTDVDDEVIPAHGSYVVDLDSFLTTGFDGKLNINSTGPVRVALNEYSVSDNKYFVNMNGKLGVPVNSPAGAASVGRVVVDGNDLVNNFAYVFTTEDTNVNLYASKERGSDGVSHVDWYVDGSFLKTSDVPDMSGWASFVENFTEDDFGVHHYRAEVYLDDGNDIVDAVKEFDLEVVGDKNVATFSYRDMDGNPTDTLHVNEPFYVHYVLENFDGYEIDGMTINWSPGIHDPEIYEFLDIDSGQSLEGEIYFEEGMDSNAENTIDQVLNPAVKVNYVGSDDWHSNVYEDAEYTLAAELVYTDIPDYKTITADSIDELAEITSREGVLFGGGTPITNEQAHTYWTNVVADNNFSGVEINDMQNRLYVYFNDSNDSVEWFDLGGQTYPAEQNVDDLEVVYNLDQQ